MLELRVAGKWRAAFAVLMGLLACTLAQAAIGIEQAWIPMPDGVRLAADIYRKVGAPQEDLLRGGGGTTIEDAPQPVLLEYLPYRKTESRARNVSLYSYFVERGYTVVRVDIRGTGNSEGVLVPHEYSEVELADGEQVIAWLAAQPWSSGKVGMFGISWGGFNAVQMTLRRPPALKAILAVNATEELYAEDVHTIGGIWHVDSWSMTQDLDNSRPGAPRYRTDEDYFRDRFDQPPWQLAYLRQQRDGPFWSRASARGRIGEIQIPMFLIGGWYDGYRSSIPRFLAQAKVPVKAIVGPWTHAWPHDASPGASIEWRRDAVRWFDHWLRGVDTGLLKEPRLAVFVRAGHAAVPALNEIPGQWRWEPGWPSPRVSNATWYLGENHALSRKAGSATQHTLVYQPASGIEAGGPVQWWGDIAPDQGPTDTASLTYDTPPLMTATEILGVPRALLAVATDASRANWMVRLSDVAPDGRITLVTGGAMNGAQRGPSGASSTEPRDIVANERMDMTVDLHFTSWVFRKGHRIRLSISNAQWPMFWPTPFAMSSVLFLGGSTGTRLQLPVARPDRPARRPAFAVPLPARGLPGYDEIEAGTQSGFGELSAMETDAQTGETVVSLRNATGTRYPWGDERSEESIEHRLNPVSPAQTSVTGTHRFEVKLPDRTLEWLSESRLESDADNFRFRYQRRLLENGIELRRREWDERVPRDYQ